jgi:hypothetical protein
LDIISYHFFFLFLFSPSYPNIDNHAVWGVIEIRDTSVRGGQGHAFHMTFTDDSVITSQETIIFLNINESGLSSSIKYINPKECVIGYLQTSGRALVIYVNMSQTFLSGDRTDSFSLNRYYSFGDTRSKIQVLADSTRIVVFAGAIGKEDASLPKIQIVAVVSDLYFDYSSYN